MVHFVQSIIWCSFICHSLCNLRKFRSTVRLHIVCNISFPLKESTMGREKGWSSGNRSKDRRRSDPIGPERFLTIVPHLGLRLAIGWVGDVGEEELVGIKEIIPPSPFYSSPRRTILLRIKHQNFVGTGVQFFKIDRQTRSLTGGGVGSAIWHGTDWQTITGRLYCQQTPTSARRLCYSLHNGSTTHNSGHNPIR